MKRQQRSTFWTVPNSLTIFRLLLIIPTVWALLSNHPIIAVIFGLLAYVSDLLDGWIARRYQQSSDLGKLLDPIVDKLFVATIVLLLFARNQLPSWYLGIVLLRDAIILLGGWYAKRRAQLILQSVRAGKVAVTSVALTLVAVVLQFPSVLINAFLSLSVALLLFSLGVYTRRWIEYLFPNLAFWKQRTTGSPNAS